jgi:hypothetical protein
MILSCSCCGKQDWELTDIQFNIPSTKEECKSSAIKCKGCSHTQEIMNIESLNIKKTIPVPATNDVEKMRQAINTTSGKNSVNPNQPPAISNVARKALNNQNIDLEFDPQGIPIVKVIDKNKPVMQSFYPIEDQENVKSPGDSGEAL